MYYIGLDVHKKTISYCVKDASGQVHLEGKVGATRWELDIWMKTLPQPWTVAMEATIFTGWIYDHLRPHAHEVKVAHPLMLRAIAAAKKKNDQVDAIKIADCLRCDFLPECYMASTEIRDRRRTLRYRHLLVRQMVQVKNCVSGLLMETGVNHNKRQLHRVGYFRDLMASNENIDESIRPLLQLSRDTITRLGKTESALVRSLQRDLLLTARVQRLKHQSRNRLHHESGGHSLLFRVYVDPSPSALADLFAKLKTYFGNGSTTVSGVGDEAYLDKLHGLHVRKGKVRYFLDGAGTPKQKSTSPLGLQGGF